MKIVRLLAVVLFLCNCSVFAQLDSFLGTIAEKDIEHYVEPFATTLGTALNSGMYHTANIPDDLGFSLSLQTIVVLIPESQRTFTPGTPDAALGYDLSQKSSTIFGPGAATIYTGDAGFISYPGGFDLKHATFPLPQISVNKWHTELVLRFVPGIKISGKKFTFYCVGLRYSFGQYFDLPFDVSAHGIYNRIELTDVVASNSTAFGLAVSKSFGILTPYAGLQFESTNVTFDYKVTEQDKRITKTIDVNGQNMARFTVGAAVKLSFVVLNTDFNLGSQNNATAGFSIQF